MRRATKAVYSNVLLILALIAIEIRAEDAPGEQLSFIRNVAPILVTKCQACHGPKTVESNYRLDTFASLMQPGDFGTAPVTPGDPEDSEIHRLITADDPHERMPNNGGQLSDSEIEVIDDWIRQGAEFDGTDAAAPLRDQIPRDLPYPAAPQSYPSALPITAMAFTSGGDRIVVGGYHELLVWDAAAATLVARVANVPQRTHGIAFNPDHSWLALAGGAPGVSGEIRLIPWNDGPLPDAQPKVLATHDDVFFDVAFRPDGAQLAAAGSDGLVRVFDVATGAERLKISAHADWVADICYSPDGKHLATASRDKTAKVFDAESGRLLTTHSEHNGPVRSVAFAPDGKSVASAGGSRIRVWNVDDSKLLGEIGGFEHDVYAVVVGSDTILAGSADRTARQFKLADRSPVRTLEPHPSWILSLAWHEATHRLSAGCFDGTVAIWDLDSGALVKQFSAFPNAR